MAIKFIAALAIMCAVLFSTQIAVAAEFDANADGIFDDTYKVDADNITAGTLGAARGGFGADVSSYEGIPLFSSGSVSEGIQYESDCSDNLSGICIDSDDWKIYWWDGGSMELIGAGSVATHETTYPHGDYDTHIAATSNPHSVTAVQTWHNVNIGTVTPSGGTFNVSSITFIRANDEYDPTPDTDDTWQGEVMDFTAGESIDQWEVCYIKHLAGSPRVYAYNADSTDSDNDTYRPIGIAVEDITDSSFPVAAGEIVSLGVFNGVARNDGWSFTDTSDEGKPVFAGNTDGAITIDPGTDLATTGDHIVHLGNLIDEDEIMFSFGNITEVVVD
jgi:hypothetical protein